ncbi:4-diphosphocytidyl-2C-methyl-D-erythritol kinase [Sinorhizobium medicae]|uniref:4-diphosphocytidyl-2-C-methyl-D-erythritol kinase n=2 Tax=Sinorhizobium medicae TaxID=110321 RepID=A0A508X4H5_9HYPH|nr:4-(cytidine 5'-diphospho)-2-C-methyl-D-erythritol kinase [Sinorhizobium medicae]MDX0521321.1 4-(cytidine 5'-diphospho)-2-C-methyl-D-erythritol kinase [Sinorhizobium medicae]MDX0545633.1 4-(cytidine 5'-diphospho)-2-C-methyl-D-erythritol kinase [Sinorhizobium medicae]MDX0633139.1 4-(cytidine 5'-diphospho)-2-C-methyl-D-erythritol kinase [Sinorhizobium medicae]MDX0713662.1 4-(cytidine 5'-diphospho)-2-C-methyl-D-erythritol kinase [Sinorhizobium medicae]MDX0768267.1 4-(cytidine 5'-diphospho)-2-C-
MRPDGIAGFALTIAAPAKINLALHVVGQRADGHHLLESLVTFAECGDGIGLAAAEADHFTVSGRFAPDLSPSAENTSGNLVLRARDVLRRELASQGRAAGPVHLHLEKNLPVASGIGGGSADAAATLRGLLSLWGASIEPARLGSLALELGADVPMCLDGRPLIARGIGEEITSIPDLPSFAIVLVNPLVEVSTPVVFRLLIRKSNPPLVLPENLRSTAAWLAALASMRNDLEPPARALEPMIEAVSTALEDAGATLVRMSGSGATCFGLFADEKSASLAAETISASQPRWYVRATRTAGKSG